MRVVANKVCSKEVLEEILSLTGYWSIFDVITFKSYKKYKSKDYIVSGNKKSCCIYYNKKTDKLELYIRPYIFLENIYNRDIFYTNHFSEKDLNIEYNYYYSIYKKIYNMFIRVKQLIIDLLYNIVQHKKYNKTFMKKYNMFCDFKVEDIKIDSMIDL